jgi:CheY-like chemotaxis protein
LCDIDKHQLSQVFDNIVLNARQAMPQGGKVEITIKNVAAADIPKSLSTNDYVCISIKDYGTGIMKEHLSQMFVPFFTTKQMGSGLGLATSYAIVKKHDGTIEVESELGKGSAFHIYLPASPSREATVCSIIKQEHTGAGSILIMDDEEFILDMLSLRLIEMGYDVAKAENGDRAVELAREAANNGKPFLIAILDLTIPGGRGGKDIAQELLAIDPAIKLVASSGYSEDPVMTTPSAYGFQKGLVKPYRKDDVARLLESLRH